MYNRRKALKMSLQAVADAAGTSKSYVWDLERGVHVPTLTVLVGIAKALEIDLSALIKELEVIVYGTI
jgi:transcriptional regulator with XRE-family HTH domain